MFWDFIDNYRKARAPEREARDKDYARQHEDVSKWRGYGAVPGIGIGHMLIGATQAADNVSRGVSDFFSAWSDSMNPGHGKIEPNDNDFFGKDSKNYADVSSLDDVDYSRDFAVYRRAPSGEAADSVNKIKVGFKNGKIATVSAYKYNPETGKEDEYSVYGRNNLANYFKKNYDYDRVYAAKPLDGDNSRTAWASNPNDTYYMSDRFDASRLFRPKQ